MKEKLEEIRADFSVVGHVLAMLRNKNWPEELTEEKLIQVAQKQFNNGMLKLCALRNQDGAEGGSVPC